VRFNTTTADLRPAVVLDKVQDGSLFGLSAEASLGAESLLRLMNCADVLLASPRVIGEASVFLRVEGEKSRGITVDGGDLRNAQKPLFCADGATNDVVKLRL